MKTERAYLNDPGTLEFTAEIIERRRLPDGQLGIVLPKTFFFPTGGGQEHDTGTLGNARVVDVIAEDDGTVIHVVDGDVPGTTAPANIDRERRFAFMQHHSAQHLLSQAFVHTLNLETLSANINIDSPSTIDLDAMQVSEADAARVEVFSNSVIYQDLPIKIYWVDETNLHTVPLRKPPKVKENIRIVEISSFDYSACGGTHCASTGMIGVIKILKIEKRADKVRIYFVAGGRAVESFQSCYNALTQVARLFDTSPESAVDSVKRLQDSFRAAQDELKESEGERLAIETRKLVAAAQSLDEIRLVTASFRNRAPQQLRALAGLLQNEPGVVAFIASYDGTKATLLVTCGDNVGVRANDLIRKALASINGRGGGDARLAQGGGVADESFIETCFANASDSIRELRH
jgi:alanyl-tRNA synthetase